MEQTSSNLPTTQCLDELASRLATCAKALEEFVSGELAEFAAASPSPDCPGGPRHPSQDDPVVAAVLAEFEKLRRPCEA